MPISLTFRDIGLFFRHPKAAILFTLGSKESAYSKIMQDIVSKLSKTSESEIRDCLGRSFETNTLVLPSQLWHLHHRKEYVGINSVLCYYVTRVLKPRTIVETGVLSGRSSFMILQALRDNNNDGKLYSIDLGQTEFSYKLLEDSRIDNQRFISYAKQANRPSRSAQDPDADTIRLPPSKGIGWLVPERLKQRWKLILGDSRIELPKLLSELGSVDIFIHDSDHSYDVMAYEFKTSWPFIKNNGMLCSDDTFFNNSWIDFSNETKSQQVVVDDTFGIMIKNGTITDVFGGHA